MIPINNFRQPQSDVDVVELKTSVKNVVFVKHLSLICLPKHVSTVVSVKTKSVKFTGENIFVILFYRGSFLFDLEHVL